MASHDWTRRPLGADFGWRRTRVRGRAAGGFAGIVVVVNRDNVVLHSVGGTTSCGCRRGDRRGGLGRRRWLTWRLLRCPAALSGLFRPGVHRVGWAQPLRAPHVIVQSALPAHSLTVRRRQLSAGNRGSGVRWQRAGHHSRHRCSRRRHYARLRHRRRCVLDHGLRRRCLLGQHRLPQLEQRHQLGLHGFKVTRDDFQRPVGPQVAGAAALPARRAPRMHI